MKLELYPFQKVSVAKLAEVSNGLNGDDMGLGKTIQAIAIDFVKRNRFKSIHGRAAGPTLIIAPKSLLETPWASHLLKYWPDVRINIIDPKNRSTFVERVDSTFKGTDRYTYHITHWDALRLLPELRRYQWFHVIADEVHRAKNRAAQQTQALKKIPAMNKLGLSGTAADNMPQDLWSVLNWLYPRTWTSFHRFYNYHVVHEEKINKKTGKTYKVVKGVHDPEKLHRAMSPFYIRRLKTDPKINLELPEKTYSEIWVDLLPKQRRAYDEMRHDMITWLGKHEDQPLAAPMVIAQLVRLQQFASAYGELVNVIRGGKQQRVLKLTEPSSKLDALMELVTDNENEQFVVFSRSSQIVGLLVERLARKDIPHVSLTGNTPMEDRSNLVEKFQRGDARIFAGTIGAGGVGITLTAASKVVFLDREWSPSQNSQAEDRLHRIGQKRNVQVIDIIARNTVDLGRLQRLEQKWLWVRAILGDDVRDMQFRFTKEKNSGRQ